MAALSDRMYEELYQAARFGYQGEMVTCNRKTEDALLRRGLVTYEYDGSRFAAAAPGHGRNPVLTVAGWALLGRTASIERPADSGRYSLAQAQAEAYDPTVSDGWRQSRNTDTGLTLEEYALASRHIQSLMPGVRR